MATIRPLTSVPLVDPRSRSVTSVPEGDLGMVAGDPGVVDADVHVRAATQPGDRVQRVGDAVDLEVRLAADIHGDGPIRLPTGAHLGADPEHPGTQGVIPGQRHLGGTHERVALLLGVLAHQAGETPR